MANWFPMALKDNARSWLMNLPEESVSSWEDLCLQFEANFKPTYDRPTTKSDLKAVKQHQGETLRKYIQRFCQVRSRIPHISDQEDINAFAAGITDEKMHEKLQIHEGDLFTAVELFRIADRCAKAEEGRLFVREGQAPSPAAYVKAKAKDYKRKEPAVLAAEPERKLSREGEDDLGDLSKPYRLFHRRHSHDISNCWEFKKLCEEQMNSTRRDERGDPRRAN